MAEHSKISITPNPMLDHFTLHYFQENKTSLDIKILNSMGQIVFSKCHDQNKTGWNNLQINLENQIPNGIYLLLIASQNKMRTEKIV